MANLTASKRAKINTKEFAGKGKTFPLNDREHQRLAIGGATRSFNAGNIGKATENRIKAKASAKLNRGRPSMAKKPEMKKVTKEAEPKKAGKGDSGMKKTGRKHGMSPC